MRDHTSLTAWQRAEAASSASTELRKRYWRPPSSHLFDQLCRAALSVQLNISEGYAFTPSPSFHRHLKIAYASAVETADALRALMATNSAPVEDVEPILDLCKQSQALILGLTRYVETSMRQK